MHAFGRGLLLWYLQGGHQPGKLGKVREFDSGQGKVREVEKVRENVFYLWYVMAMWWSQNKYSLTGWVLLSADDMSVMDWQRSKQKLILPIHIIVIMFYLSHLWANSWFLLSCSLTSTPMLICVLSLVCRKHLEKSGNLMRTGKWPPCIFFCCSSCAAVKGVKIGLQLLKRSCIFFLGHSVEGSSVSHGTCVYYLRHRLASGEDIVLLGVRLSRCVCVRRISLDGEGNALYRVLSSSTVLLHRSLVCAR